MASYFTIYLSKRGDSDLISLLLKIGYKNFRRLAKASILSLNHPEYIGKAPEYIKTGQDIPIAMEYPVTIRIHAADREYDFVKELMKHLKYRKQGAFLKQVMRYYIGPLTLLPLFFNSEINLPTKQLYTPLIINGVLNASPKIRHRRKSTSPSSTSRAVIPNTPSSDVSVGTAPTTGYGPPGRSVEYQQSETFYSDAPAPSVEDAPVQESSTEEQDEILSLLNNMLS